MCLSFGAFAVWWDRFARGRVGLPTWCLCGVILAFGAMAKGPPALVFFALGSTILHIRERRLGELPGLAACLTLSLAGVIVWAGAVYQDGYASLWLYQMIRGQRFRLWKYVYNKAQFLAAAAAACLPWLAAVGVPLILRRDRAVEWDRALGRALLIYAAAGTAAVFLVLETNTRYALPAVPAMAVQAGLIFDALRVRNRRAVRILAGVLVAAAILRLAYVIWLLPMNAQKHAPFREAAATVSRFLGTGPVYKCGEGMYGVMYYLHRLIVEVTAEELASRREGETVLLDSPALLSALPSPPTARSEVLANVQIGDKNDQLIVVRITPVQ
jgi:hypothetical protein